VSYAVRGGVASELAERPVWPVSRDVVHGPAWLRLIGR
jgi:hypothetical protein